MELTCRGLGFCSSGFQEGCRGREMQDDKSGFPFCACVHAGRACHPGRYPGAALLEGLVWGKRMVSAGSLARAVSLAVSLSQGSMQVRDTHQSLLSAPPAPFIKRCQSLDCRWAAVRTELGFLSALLFPSGCAFFSFPPSLYLSHLISFSLSLSCLLSV